MRQLSALGFMHNRLRMITSMFLTKDLRIHWRDGEAFFMRKLVDGEIASNNGGWQWSAGTGADAAPYFRIQNPWTQSQRFDPNGDFIREWVPELRDVRRRVGCTRPWPRDCGWRRITRRRCSTIRPGTRRGAGDVPAAPRRYFRIGELMAMPRTGWGW